jgi:hypothetical protein
MTFPDKFHPRIVAGIIHLYRHRNNTDWTARLPRPASPAGADRSLMGRGRTDQSALSDLLQASPEKVAVALLQNESDAYAEGYVAGTIAVIQPRRALISAVKDMIEARPAWCRGR